MEEDQRRIAKAMDLAENAFRTNYIINLVIVFIGVAFLLSSLFFAYYRGLDASTLTFAGLGIADFVALFLVNPQTRNSSLSATSVKSRLFSEIGKYK